MAEIRQLHSQLPGHRIISVNHHAIFEHIARVDRALLFLNLLLLLVVAFIPFPTAVLARTSLASSHR